MTKKKTDPFDGQLSLPPEFLPVYSKPFVAPSVARRKKQFAQFPMWWAERLGTGLSPRNKHAWSLATYILHRFWKNKNKPFKLPNMALGAATEMDRYAKYRALATLERLGLVAVQRKSGKSPIITPLLVEPETASTPS